MLYDVFMGENGAGSEELLPLGNEYYKAVYKSLPIGIALFNQKGFLFHVNPALVKIFGILSIDDLLGLRLFDDATLPPDASQRLQNGETIFLTELVDFDAIQRANFHLAPDKTVVYVDFSVTALKKKNQGIRGYLVQVQDVTERELAKKALHETQRHLEQLVRVRTDALAQVNRKLQEELEERQRIVAMEKEQRTLADAMRDIVMALANKLDFKQVVGQILGQIGKVIPSDAVTLLTIEGDHISHVHSRGFTQVQANAFIYAEKVPITEYPNLVIALSHREAVLITDTREYIGWVPHEETSWIASNITTPIISMGIVIGFINVYNKKPGFYTQKHVELINVFARQAAVAIHNARLYEEMQRLAIVDELTGLYNRRGLYEVGMREVSRVQRFKRSLTALFFDIDHFKQFNDRYSYEVGDRVLQFLSKSVGEQLRDVDIFARYGGEEFVVLLPEISLRKGAEIAERLRAHIAANGLQEQGQILRVTVSIGVAPLIARPSYTDLLAGREPELLKELIERAGEKLHKAKADGRNRVAF